MPSATRKRLGQMTGAVLVRQPGSELNYDDTGMVEGQLIFAFDENQWAAVTPYLGRAHPDDPNVTLYRLRRVRNAAGVELAVFDCIGVSKDPTDRVVSYPATVTTEPIETHPDFADSEFAGTPGDPENGAVWDPDSGEFIGFVGAGAPAELRGVRSYYVGSVIARATYYTRTPPRFRNICKITPSLPNIPDIPGVKNWLYLPPSSEQIGRARLWRVTEEFLGSGPAGWSDIIYG
jgi:hypothetical protein